MIPGKSPKERKTQTAELYDYLSTNLNDIRGAGKEYERFEVHVRDTIALSYDQKLKDTLRKQGWTGKHFNTTVNLEDCLQALGNLHLAEQAQLQEGSSSQSEVERVLWFTPKCLLSVINSEIVEKESEESYIATNFMGTILLVDVADYNIFSATSAQQGSAGLDQLQVRTKWWTVLLCDTVARYGGDVAVFGDLSLLCVFKDDDQHSKVPSTVRAALCGWALSKLSDGAMSARVCIGSGNIQLSIVGGINDSWKYLLQGPCVQNMRVCMKETLAGEMMVTKAFNETCSNDWSDFCASQKLLVKDKALVVLRVTDTGNMRLDVSAMTSYVNMDLITSGNINVSQAVVDVARLFVCQPCVSAISAGFSQPPELRTVTTVCFRIIYQNQSRGSMCNNLTGVFRLVQQLLHDSGGYLKRFEELPKGFLVTVMLGVPLFTYDSNSTRGLYCAMALRKHCDSLQYDCSVGISSGTVYCGLVGSQGRMDYMCVGHSVFEAERLMSLANNSILLDDETYQQVPFNIRPTLRQQQVDGTNPIFACEGTDAPPATMLQDFNDADAANSKSVVLRRNVRKLLSTHLDRISNALGGAAMDIATTRNISESVRSVSQRSISRRSDGGQNEGGDTWGRGALVSILHGPAGTGKSIAAHYLVQSCRKRKLQCIRIQCHTGDENQPYKLLQKIFLELVGHNNFRSEDQQRKVIGDLLEGIAVAATSSSLRENQMARAFEICQTILGLKWSRGDVGGEVSTSGGGPQNIAIERTSTFFHDALVVLLKQERTVLVIDDAQFCDELSWHQMLQVVLGQSMPMAIFIFTRIAVQMHFELAHGTSDTARNRSMKTALYPITAGTPTQTPNFGFGATTAATAAAGGGGGRTAGPVGLSDAQVIRNASFFTIASHESCVHLELTSLKHHEVGELLQQEIPGHLTPSMLTTICEFTNGDAFWCNAVAQYIKLHGIEAFTHIATSDKGKHSGLTSIVLARLDLLSFEHQMVARHAAVVGLQFTAELLVGILPPTSRAIYSLHDYLEHLVDQNLIMCIDDAGGVYEFQNGFVQSSIYELTLQSDANDMHHAIAQFLDSQQSTNYSLLSHHYRKCLDSRYPALKFTVKAAVKAVCAGAYGEGLEFLQLAVPLANKKSEMRALLDIVNQTKRFINPSTGIFGMFMKFSERHSSSNNSLNVKDDDRSSIASSTFGATPNPASSGNSAAESARVYAQYKQLGVDIEAAIKQFSMSRNILAGADASPRRMMGGDASELTDADLLRDFDKPELKKKQAGMTNTRSCTIS